MGVFMPLSTELRGRWILRNFGLTELSGSSDDVSLLL
jgi:hypothetical protein